MAKKYLDYDGLLYLWSRLKEKFVSTTNDYQTSAQVEALISNAVSGITSFEFKLVSTLPTSGEKGTVYLLPHSHGTNDGYDEYIWVQNKFEKIGSTDIDLSNYVTKETGKGLFSGSYTDLTNKPDLTKYVQKENGKGLFSGNYDDLTNKPTLFNGAYSSLTGKPDLTVYVQKETGKGLFSGSYDDLTNKPTIPEGAVVDSALSSTSTNAVQNSVLYTEFAKYVKNTDSRLTNARTPVAHTHSKSEITDFPTIPTVPTSEISANTAARHTHSNKSILDGITKTPLFEHQSLAAYLLAADVSAISNSEIDGVVDETAGGYNSGAGK